MNYTTLSLKELIHYGELDATTELEKALVAMLVKHTNALSEKGVEDKNMIRQLFSIPA
jgi:hypothetical protein